MKTDIALNFDISSDISYKDFRHHKSCQNEIVELNANISKVRGKGNLNIEEYFVTMLTIQLGTIMNSNSDTDFRVISQAATLLQSDYSIEYDGISDENISNIAEELSNFGLQESVPEVIQEILVGDNKEMSVILNEGANTVDMLESEAPDIFKKIQNELKDSSYKITKKQNARCYFTLFQVLTNKGDIFYVHNQDDYPVICSEDKLVKNIHAYSVVINLSALLLSIIPDKLIESVLETKSKYNGDRLLDVVLQKITRHFEVTNNLEILVSSKVDLNRYDEIKKLLPNASREIVVYDEKPQHAKFNIKFNLKDRGNSL